MLLLVNGATKDVEPLVGDPHLGVLITPGSKGGGPKQDIKRIVDWGVEWSADNGAYSGLDLPAFLKLLAAIAIRPKCRWLAAPDKVGDAAETLRRFRIWGPVIREIGVPVAFVTQDGLRMDQVPWDDLDAIFVGGGQCVEILRCLGGDMRRSQSTREMGPRRSRQ